MVAGKELSYGVPGSVCVSGVHESSHSPSRARYRLTLPRILKQGHPLPSLVTPNTPRCIKVWHRLELGPKGWRLSVSYIPSYLVTKVRVVLLT